MTLANEDNIIHNLALTMSSTYKHQIIISPIFNSINVSRNFSGLTQQ